MKTTGSNRYLQQYDNSLRYTSVSYMIVFFQHEAVPPFIEQ